MSDTSCNACRSLRPAEHSAPEINECPCLRVETHAFVSTPLTRPLFDSMLRHIPVCCKTFQHTHESEKSIERQVKKTRIVPLRYLSLIRNIRLLCETAFSNSPRLASNPRIIRVESRLRQSSEPTENCVSSTEVPIWIPIDPGWDNPRGSTW